MKMASERGTPPWGLVSGTHYIKNLPKSVLTGNTLLVLSLQLANCFIPISAYYSVKQQLFAASWVPTKTIVIGFKKNKEAKACSKNLVQHWHSAYMKYHHILVHSMRYCAIAPSPVSGEGSSRKVTVTLACTGRWILYCLWQAEWTFKCSTKT